MSRSGAARACALIALTAALAGACGSDDSTSTADTATTTAVTAAPPSTTASTAAAPTTTTTAAPGAIEVTYAGGQVTGGVRTETVALGATVRLRVTSDVAEEVHVHTYDVGGRRGTGRDGRARVQGHDPRAP